MTRAAPGYESSLASYSSVLPKSTAFSSWTNVSFLNAPLISTFTGSMMVPQDRELSVEAARLEPCGLRMVEMQDRHQRKRGLQFLGAIFLYEVICSIPAAEGSCQGQKHSHGAVPGCVLAPVLADVTMHGLGSPWVFHFAVKPDLISTSDIAKGLEKSF